MNERKEWSDAEGVGMRSECDEWKRTMRSGMSDCSEQSFGFLFGKVGFLVNGAQSERKRYEVRLERATLNSLFLIDFLG